MRKLALVTGGSGAIGKAIVADLSKKYDVAFTFNLNSDEAQKIESENDHTKAFHLNLLNAESLKKTYSEVKSFFNKEISILINNAGIANEPTYCINKSTADMDEKIFRVNFFSPIALIQLVLPDMYKQKFGRIVNISSISAPGGTPGYSTYSSSKIALETYSKTVSVEVGHRGITINSIRPGITESAMSKKYIDDLKTNGKILPILNGKDVSEFVAFIVNCGDKFNGQTLTVDYGLTNKQYRP